MHSQQQHPSETQALMLGSSRARCSAAAAAWSLLLLSSSSAACRTPVRPAAITPRTMAATAAAAAAGASAAAEGPAPRVLSVQSSVVSGAPAAAHARVCSTHPRTALTLAPPSLLPLLLSACACRRLCWQQGSRVSAAAAGL